MLAVRGLLALFVIVTVFYAFFVVGNPDLARSPFASFVGPSNLLEKAAIAKKRPTDLNKVLSEKLKDELGDYGVAVIDLKNDRSYYYNEHMRFDTASLYKLWVMAVAYQQLQNGNLQHDNFITQSVPSLNSEFNIDPRYAERNSGYVSDTTGDALTKMITVSDNYAALLLTEKVQIRNIISFLQNNAFTESSFGSDVDLPYSTPYDTAMFFKKLYKGGLADDEHTHEMIELLKAQKINTKLPVGLPDGTVIAHKTGELNQFSHDAGIVFTDNGDYVIVVMSKTPDPSHANEVISKIASEVHKYFTL